ncbi:hypothetical protein D3C72_2568070 [compost metagenome]
MPLPDFSVCASLDAQALTPKNLDDGAVGNHLTLFRPAGSGFAGAFLLRPLAGIRMRKDPS